MRIGINISGVLPTDGHLRGIGRYSFQWLAALAKEHPDWRFFCYHPQASVFDSTYLPTADNIRLVPLPSVPGQWGAAQEAMLATNHDRLDVHVQTHPFDISSFHGLPRREHSPVPLATIFYDLIPLLRPGECLFDPTFAHGYHCQLDVVSKYDLLLAISESSRREALEHLRIPADRVHAVGCATSGTFRPPRPADARADAESLAAIGIVDPYFLFVGLPHERRKNFWCLIEAAACLPAVAREECQIVLVSPGPAHIIHAEVQRGVDKGVKIVWVERPDDDLLRILYQRSRAVVFPSVHEGFGLPVLEAMQCGAPVLSADATSLPEVGGDSVLYFDPRVPMTLTTRLAEMLYADEAERAELGRRGIERAAKFNWSRVATATAKAFCSLAPKNAIPTPKTPEGSCWIDVTCLMGDLAPAGIPRTVACLVAHWPEHLRSKIRFFQHQAGAGLQPVDDGLAWERVNFAAKSGGSQTRLAVPVAPAPARTPSRLKEIERAFRRFWKSIPKRLGFRRAEPDRASAVAEPGAAALRWSAEDVVFLPGGHFPSEEYFAELVQRQQGGAVPVWTLVYDLLPEIRPQYFDAWFAPFYSAWLRNTLSVTSRVVAISEQTRKDCESFCERQGFACPETVVVRLGDELASVDDSQPEDCGALAERFADAPFVLCVSHLTRRKNQELLYQVWRRMLQDGRRPTPHLVLVGGMSGRPEFLDEILRDPLVAGRVHLLERIPESQLRWLYRNSAFVMYPSVYEGWGLPVAEALACGKYVIASDASSIPEIGGDLVDYHDPFDFIGCYKLVTRALDDAAYVRRREDRVRREYRTTSWADAAEQVAAALLPARKSRTEVGPIIRPPHFLVRGSRTVERRDAA